MPAKETGGRPEALARKALRCRPRLRA